MTSTNGLFLLLTIMCVVGAIGVFIRSRWSMKTEAEIAAYWSGVHSALWIIILSGIAVSLIDGSFEPDAFEVISIVQPENQEK